MPTIVYNSEKRPKFNVDDAKCGICLNEYA